MYDTFSMNLEKSTEVEAVAQKNYESLIGVKENEMATLVDARKKKEGEKADAEKDLADASQDLDDTTKQMKADTVFFDETKAACQAKADELKSLLESTRLSRSSPAMTPRHFSTKQSSQVKRPSSRLILRASPRPRLTRH